MSYSVCVRSGGLCTGCMACQGGGYDEEQREADAIDEVLEWFVSPWECFLAVIKHSELFADDNKEFARVEKVVDGDAAVIYWDDGVEVYQKDEVEEWTSSDFKAYLSLYDGDAFVSVMEREKRS